MFRQDLPSVDFTNLSFELHLFFDQFGFVGFKPNLEKFEKSWDLITSKGFLFLLVQKSLILEIFLEILRIFS